MGNTLSSFPVRAPDGLGSGDCIDAHDDPDGSGSTVYLKWILLLQIIPLQWTQLMDLWSSGATIIAVTPSACSLKDMTDRALDGGGTSAATSRPPDGS